MPTVQTGARGTIDILDDRIVREMVSKIALLEPSARPLTTVMNNLEKVVMTRTPEPQHMEDELEPMVDLVNGAQTAADVTIEVDNVGYFLVGDIVHVPRTGENFRVTAVAASLTVVRGVGAVAAAAMVDDEPIFILGGAQREGDTSRNAINTLEVQYTSQCQIVRNSIEATGTQLATQLYDGSDFDYQFEKSLIRHKRQLEFLFKFGTVSRTSVSGEWLRTMGGLWERIQTNRFAVDGVLTEGDFDLVCQMAFRYGNALKLGVFAPRVIQSVTNFAKNRLQTVPADESYGLVMRDYMSPYGTLRLVNDWGMFGTVYGASGMILDVDNLAVRYLRAGPEGNRAQAYQGSLYCKRITNIQANDSDTRKDEVFSEVCLQIIQEKTHAILTGVQG